VISKLLTWIHCFFTGHKEGWVYNSQEGCCIYFCRTCEEMNQSEKLNGGAR
jgi:hypothetical protein